MGRMGPMCHMGARERWQVASDDGQDRGSASMARSTETEFWAAQERQDFYGLTGSPIPEFSLLLASSLKTISFGFSFE